MKINLIFFVIGLAFLAQLALSIPVDIIYRGGDCPCARGSSSGDSGGCESMSYGYGMSAIANGGRHGSGDCSQPRFRVRTGNNQVKYIFDYNIEVPVEKTEEEARLTDLYARVDKILVDAGSAKIVNTDCTCNNRQAVESGLVGPCPRHTQQTSRTCGSRNGHSGSRYAINFIPTRLEISTVSSRSKRSVPQDHTSAKKFVNIQPIGHHNAKHNEKHQINKREIVGESLLSKPIKNLKRHSEIVQYFPEVLSPNFKPGQCYTNSASKRSADSTQRYPLDLASEPQQIAPGTRTDPTHYAGQLAATSMDASIPMTQSQKETDEYYLGTHQGMVIQPGQSYPDYIRSVVYSHDDYIKASGHTTELIESEETQKEDANEYIQKLMDDELSGIEGVRFARQKSFSSEEAVSASSNEEENSFLIKLRNPLSKV